MEFEFDDHVYRRMHPDVAAAIEKGKIQSSRAHYEEYGRNEGRALNPIDDNQPRVFGVGAYGTRNIGDDAIFYGLDLHYPNVIQLYINEPTQTRAVEMYAMNRGANRFRPEDHLIIGGGGLLYGKETVQFFLELAGRARDVGAKITIERIGCESLEASYIDKTKELFSIANSVSVRTTLSQQIVADKLGMIVPREEDFAFSLRDRMATARGRKRDRSSIPTIGVVTGGDVLVDRSDLVRLISFWTSNNREQRVRFVHIPQSFSYVSYRNNDTIVGLKIEAEIKSFLQERSLLFKTLPYENNIDKLFDTYLHLDGVISERLHGLIFAHMANLPLMAITGGHPKFQSFCEDYKNDQIFQVDNNNFIDQSFREMLTMVMR